ncbi:thiamine diphosphokinase [Candidatus Wirthbacteria bacterium CG2_30_54_11]|uniref:Thiamine diphosphokinase n=1 Tax=Candidatus Wirthbacteria bacterium CG2_30_54_11 TaxID=1817892 RepID=A0A1J5IL54_9BACT|nr:MAG: thiamine diphosphokinase [Candidatus Wirthbacteria bacterium CG2_30_54_11]
MEKAARSCLVFLNGKYDLSNMRYYLDEIRNAGTEARVIAVDGGLRIFDHLRLVPDLIVGDLDSVENEILSRFADVPRRQFDRDKDLTDGELAVRIVLEEDAGAVSLYGWEAKEGEVDHMFGNALLLFLGTNLTLRSPGIEVRAAADSGVFFSGVVGDRLSVVPLSCQIEVKYRGCRFPLIEGEVVTSAFGETRTLRNEFMKTQVEVQIKGKALVIHQAFQRP